MQNLDCQKICNELQKLREAKKSFDDICDAMKNQTVKKVDMTTYHEMKRRRSVAQEIVGNLEDLCDSQQLNLTKRKRIAKERHKYMEEFIAKLEN